MARAPSLQPESVFVIVRWGASVIEARRVRSGRDARFCDDAAALLWSDGVAELVAEPERHVVREGCVVRCLTKGLEITADARCEEPFVAARSLPSGAAVLSDTGSLALHAAVFAISFFFYSPLASSASGSFDPALADTLPAIGVEGAGGGERTERATANALIHDPGARTHDVLTGADRSPHVTRGWPQGPTSTRGLRSPVEDVEDMIGNAKRFGMVGLLDPLELPTRPSFWPGLAGGGSIGSSPGMSATDGEGQGRGWGALLDPGIGGLGLSGTGEGGGCSDGCTGIGLGSIGTIGHGAGSSDSYASSMGLLGESRHRHTAPVVDWTGDTTSRGRLPPEVIQRVMRQSFGRFRGCYQEGEAQHAGGRVTLRFVIGRDGAVSTASATGDGVEARVAECAAEAMRSIGFPAPEGGVVRVTYPILFTND